MLGSADRSPDSKIISFLHKTDPGLAYQSLQEVGFPEALSTEPWVKAIITSLRTRRVLGNLTSTVTTKAEH